MTLGTRPDSEPQIYQLKVLYGPLCGLELSLEPGRHFFVTAPGGQTDPVLDTSALAQTSGCYVIPGARSDPSAYPNFAIAFDDAPQAHDRSVRTSPKARGNQSSSAPIDSRGSRHDARPGECAVIEIFLTDRAAHSHSSGAGPRSDTHASITTHRILAGDIFSFAGLRLAWRRIGEPWPDPVLHEDADEIKPASPEMQTPCVAHAAAPTLDTIDDAAPGIRATAAAAPYPHPRNLPNDLQYPRRHWPLRALIGLSVAAGIAALGIALQSTRAQPNTNAIDFALRGAPHPGIVLTGRDGRIHVIVRSAHDAAWTRQALRHVARTVPFDVHLESDESQTIATRLERQGIALHTVRFDRRTPGDLVVVTDAEPLQASELATARKVVLDALPYIGDVRIEQQSRADVIARARAGLDALNVRYRQTQHHAQTTFELDGAIDDARLSAIGDFARAFTDDWGRRHVRFLLDPPPDAAQLDTYRIRAARFLSTGRDTIEFTEPVS
ncbi:PrgH/EprH family type III secretion apparatus protein [Pararobbsia silviterrae]|nr:PrgH/EprH family type III secretion apparatus protein [Pararobbsia silviterrae]